VRQGAGMTGRSWASRSAPTGWLLSTVLLVGLSASCSDAEPRADSDESPAPTPSTPTTGSATRHEAVIATVTTGTGPIFLSATDQAVWVELHRENKVARIDPETNEQAEVLEVPVHCEIAAAKGSVWATYHAEGLVTRFDVATGEIVQQVPVPGACGIGVDGDSAWISSPDSGTLYRVVEGRSAPAESFPIGEAPFAVLPAEAFVWVLSEADGGVLRRMDRVTHKVKTVARLPLADQAMLAFGHLWVTARDGGHLWQLDPTTGRVLAERKMSMPTGMVRHGNWIWVTSQYGSVTAINPKTLKTVATADTGYRVLGPPVFAFGSLWTSALDENLVLRVDVARIRKLTGR